MRTLPRHIGIIMDGNGRWAELRGLPRFEGHRRGVERTKEVIMGARSLGIEVLSLYAFSIENWMRPEDEVSVIMQLLEDTLKGEFLNFMKEEIRFRVIGNRDMLPAHVRDLIEYTEKATENNRKMLLQSALSYGGRDEIVRAVRRVLQCRPDPSTVTEETVSGFLDTAGTEDPDLIIRTSGEQRLSNFLIWQSAYAEFYFTQTLWPDFTKEEMIEAVQEYRSRDRRFGRVARGTF